MSTGNNAHYAAPLWEKVLPLMVELELVEQVAIDSWFQEVEAIDFDENVFTICTPTSLSRDIIRDRFSGCICEALKKLCLSEFTLVVVDKSELELKGLPEKEKSVLDEYTFDNFVVGRSNEIVQAHARRIAENNTVEHNPFFIHGNSGLGKTHLICAIANEKKRLYPHLAVKYSTSESWLNEFLESLESVESKNEFKRKYRNLDMFLLDDVQLLGSAAVTLEELFNTFNELYLHKKQIIFTSDIPPGDLLNFKNFTKRMTSRFGQGLTLQMQSIDTATRMAIIQKKASLRGRTLPLPIVELIAEKFTDNVRDIEGILSTVIAFGDLENTNSPEEENENGEPNLKRQEERESEWIMQCVKEILYTTEFVVTAEKIIQEVAKYFCVTEEQIRLKGRNKELVYARNVAVHLLQDMKQMSQTEIGKELGNRDHSTISNSLSNINDIVKKGTAEEKKSLQRAIDDIKHRVHSQLGK